MSGSLRFQPEEQRRRALAREQRQPRANGEPDREQPAGLPHHHADDLRTLRAERDADPNLLPALRDGERDHAVEADHREHRRQRAEEPGQHRQQALAQQAVANARLEDVELREDFGM